MKSKILLTAFAAAAMLASCSKSGEPEPTPTIPGDEIRAMATVQGVDADAKGATKAAVTEVNGLKVLVLTSANQTDFTTPYAKGTMTFTSATAAGYDDADFSGTKTLPTDNTLLYMVGLYPHTGWANGTDANTQKFTFNGTQDVLICEDQCQVVRGGVTVASFIFKHLLTKIDIAVKAEDQAAIDAWGNIQKIEITKVLGVSKFEDVAEVYPAAYDYEIKSSSSAPAVWPTYLAADGNTLFASQTLALTTSSVAAATTMMGEFTATNAETDLEISVTTKTATGSAVVTPIKVALVAGNTQGKQYTINLTFKTKQIKGTATLTPWESTTPIDKDVD